MVWNTGDENIQPKREEPEWVWDELLEDDDPLVCSDCGETILYDDHTLETQLVNCDHCGTQHKLKPNVDYDVYVKQ